MISILLPSRGRPDNVFRLHRSLRRTTVGSWEMIVRLDDDDPSRDQYPAARSIRYIHGPRVILSSLWNECYDEASGDVLCQAGDDITFNTPGWDLMVRGAFPPDGIAFVHGDDLSPNGKAHGTHGFVRREWVETVGVFLPPYFSSDWSDTWLNEVANALDRRVYVPIVTEHHHFAFDKAPLDATYEERMVRHKEDDADAVYVRTRPERQEWVEKLLAVMR